MTRGFGGAGGERDPAPSAIVPERRYITVRRRGGTGGKKSVSGVTLSEKPKSVAAALINSAVDTNTRGPLERPAANLERPA